MERYSTQAFNHARPKDEVSGEETSGGARRGGPVTTLKIGERFLPGTGMAPPVPVNHRAGNVPHRGAHPPTEQLDFPQALSLNVCCEQALALVRRLSPT